MKDISIKRRGGFLYARGYRKLVLAAELIYLLVGAGLSFLAIAIFGTILAAVVLFSLVLLFVIVIWAIYQALLWFFRREARESVDITGEGVLETVDGRQKCFIPWEGVSQIELNATVIAGASLRIKGSFSEISISNLDLVIAETRTIREMNHILRQAGPIKELVAEIQAHAPNTALKMNTLAARRYKEPANPAN